MSGDPAHEFVDANVLVYAFDASALWTEDLNDGQLVRGIRVRDPFVAGQ